MRRPNPLTCKPTLDSLVAAQSGKSSHTQKKGKKRRSKSVSSPLIQLPDGTVVETGDGQAYVRPAPHGPMAPHYPKLPFE